MKDPGFRDYLIAMAGSKRPPDENAAYAELRGAMVQVGNAYEELGILVKRGIVDKDMFLDRYSWVRIGRWKLMETQRTGARETPPRTRLVSAG